MRFTIMATLIAGSIALKMGQYKGVQEGGSTIINMDIKSTTAMDFTWDFNMFGIVKNFDCKDVSYITFKDKIEIPQEGNPCIQGIAESFREYFTIEGSMTLPIIGDDLYLKTGLFDCVDVLIKYVAPANVKKTTT